MAGGPRACALEPSADGGRMKVRSRQRSALISRSTSTMEACGSVDGVALLPTQHNVQQAPLASWWSACCEMLSSAAWVHMTPAAGSPKVSLSARQAAIGAKICTSIASMTIGRSLPSRRRIFPPAFRAESYHGGSGVSSRHSGRFAQPSSELERFQAKHILGLDPRMDAGSREENHQIKIMEPASDSIRDGKTLARSAHQPRQPLHIQQA